MTSAFSTRLAVPLVVLLLAGCSPGAPTGSSRIPSASPLAAFTWTQVDPDPASDAGPEVVVGWNGGLLGVGSGLAWSSPDGVTWTSAVLPDGGDGGTADIVVHGGRAIAAGSAGSMARVRSTTDGSTWTSCLDPDFAPGDGYTGSSVGRVAVGPGGVIIGGLEWSEAGQHPVIWTSEDGTDWSRTASLASTGGIRAVASDGAGWVAVGVASVPANDLTKAAFWRSQDGRSWTELADDGTRMRVEPVAVAWTGAGYVAVGYEGILTGNGAAFRPQAWRSDDGTSWSRAEATDDTSIWPFPGATPVANEGALGGGTMVDLVDLEGGLLAVGSYWGLDPALPSKDGMHLSLASRGVAWTSMDGTAWTLGPEALFTAPARKGDEGGSVRYALRRAMVVDGRPIVTGVVPGAGWVLWRGSPVP